LNCVSADPSGGITLSPQRSVLFFFHSRRLCGGRQAVVALENWRSYGASPTIAGFTGRAPTALVSVGGESSAIAAKAATATIPIVSLFTDDPVERGLVASLNRPGGNVMGISLMNGALEAKRLGLLHEMVPKAATLGFLLNPSYPGTASQLRDIQEAAHTIGLQLHVLNAGTDQRSMRPSKPLRGPAFLLLWWPSIHSSSLAAINL
jgi:ABC-type uncharacterized transport system substrate-binding protein